MVFRVVDNPPRTDAGFKVTAETVGGVVMLLTVTETAALVPELPAESVAIAVRVCGPLVAAVVSQLKLYAGPAPATGLPRLVPSNWNCTPVKETISEALAVRVTVPLSVAPAAGAVSRDGQRRSQDRKFVDDIVGAVIAAVGQVGECAQIEIRRGTPVHRRRGEANRLNQGAVEIKVAEAASPRHGHLEQNSIAERECPLFLVGHSNSWLRHWPGM